MEWDEAIDHVVDLPPLVIPPGGSAADELLVHLESGSETELVHRADGTLVGRFVRERIAIDGAVRVATAHEPEGSPYVKVTVTVENTTPGSDNRSLRRDVVAQSLVAVHTMLAVDGATFVSLLDPPDDAAEAARACRSDGTFRFSSAATTWCSPRRSSSTTTPRWRPEPGRSLRRTEIDEILALRVMTLTDTEKAEARGTDPRAAAIIDRCDSHVTGDMGRLHGRMRPVEPEWSTLTTPGRRPLLVGPGVRRVCRPVEGLGLGGGRRARRRGPPCSSTRREGPTHRTCSRWPVRHRGRSVHGRRRRSPPRRHPSRRPGGERADVAGPLSLFPSRRG